jgi:S-formylglutathione hydrolase FrmB
LSSSNRDQQSHTRKEAHGVVNALLDSSLTDGLVPITVGVLCAFALVGVILRAPGRRWAVVYSIAAVSGAGIGFGIAWFLGDVQDDFGVTLAFSTRAWFAFGVAGVAVALVSLWRARPWRIAVAVASILLFALVAGLGINATVGEYPTVADALGVAKVHSLHLAKHARQKLDVRSVEPLWQRWQAPADLPKTGTIGAAVIPATVSHFAARSAIVYLPPAALVKDAPALPVMIFLGGQPGSPQTVVESGQMPEILNAFAAQHDGLAPIVVIPDQLGAPQNNPMCLNSPLGQVQTYLTVDVRNWITSHLNVLTSRDDWTIAGFSEGGTCSIQLGTRFRDMFGSIADISGQVAPFNGSVERTIRVGFGGSEAAYRADTAPALLAAGAPFDSTLGIFAVGQDDAKYGWESAVVEKDARAAGMDVHSFVSPGTGHDWYTEQYGVKEALPLLAVRWGLASS